MQITPTVAEAINQHITGVQPKKLDAIDITPLFPKKKPATIWDSISPGKSPFGDLFSLLNNVYSSKLILFQLNNTITTDQDSGEDYERYLQYPNANIQALADTIVDKYDSDDTKMYKIEQWVQNNITYVSDAEQYKEPELWAFPTMTIDSMEGDCEDGAFLIHSLALHAGVDSDRLRTYGGIVVTGAGTGVGGHAWTAYKRESDNEWIVLDWCYWAQSSALSERQSMSEDLKYLDDWFFVTATKTVETPYTNRVRYATDLKPLTLSVRV